MKQKTQSTDIKGNLLVALIRTIGLLPLPLASRLGRLLGKLVWAFGGTYKNVTLVNIKLCFPELSASQQKHLAKESIIDTISTVMEFCVAWTQPIDQLLARITHIENEELLKAAHAKNKGVILVVPHFGNWELSNFYIAKHYPLIAMFKPGESEAFNRLILESRSQLSEMATADAKGVGSLLKSLKAGKVTGILSDQEPTRNSGVWAPLFGIDALTPNIVSRLAKKTGATVIGYGCQRNPDGKSFHLFFEPVDDEMYSDTIEESAAAMNRCIEQIILRDPAQYQWEYKRFKRRPNESPNPYRGL